MSRIDFTLAVRMMARYPGLTVVSVLALSVAIAIGAVSFTTLYSYMQPAIPLPEGERLVALDNWDAAANQPEPHAMREFLAWQTELKTLRDLGAYRTVRRNLIVPGGQVETVTAAEITASGFRAARVPALLGRTLTDADERSSAAVAVIGYDLWRSRFFSDQSVIGRTMRLGPSIYSIVGVMPRGFGFPVNHEIWIPLRTAGVDEGPRQGPAIAMFGRLAPGATLEDARAELDVVGKRAAAAMPSTHAQLRPRVMPFAALYDAISGADAERWQVHVIQSLFSLILILVGANVAVLIYARTASRMAEIAVRTALGASRARIVTQLFAEALVLAALAAGLGVAVGAFAMRELDTALLTAGGGLPFWISPGLSAGSLVYVVGLSLAGAAIAGILPALQATGRHVHNDLRQLGGSTGLRLGRTWSALIVSQVAFAVAILPWVVFQASVLAPYAIGDPAVGVPSAIVARVAVDSDAVGAADQYRGREAMVRTRLTSEPGVDAVTFSTSAPGEEAPAFVEVEGMGLSGVQARFNRVAPDFFAAFSVPLLAGRDFQGVAAASSDSVVVNRSFGEQLLGGASPLGRRVRYVTPNGARAPEGVVAGRWYEIVGVVADFPARPAAAQQPAAKLYHPLPAEDQSPVVIGIRIHDPNPTAMIARVRALAPSVDASLRLDDMRPLDTLLREERGMIRLGTAAVLLVAAAVLMLSAAGIYALMSFTVARRRREIGIRIALGADSVRVVRAVFARAARQIAAGIAVGSFAAIVLDRATGGQVMHGHTATLLPVIAALMGATCLAATVIPTKRALGVQPTDALRAEA